MGAYWRNKKDENMHGLAFFATSLLSLHNYDVPSKRINQAQQKPQNQRGELWSLHESCINALRGDSASSPQLLLKGNQIRHCWRWAPLHLSRRPNLLMCYPRLLQACTLGQARTMLHSGVCSCPKDIRHRSAPSSRWNKETPSPASTKPPPNSCQQAPHAGAANQVEKALTRETAHTVSTYLRKQRYPLLF